MTTAPLRSEQEGCPHAGAPEIEAVERQPGSLEIVEVQAIGAKVPEIPARSDALIEEIGHAAAEVDREIVVRKAVGGRNGNARDRGCIQMQIAGADNAVRFDMAA